MKKTFIKVLTTVLAATLFAGALAACGSKENNEPTKAPVENNQNNGDQNNNQNNDDKNPGNENQGNENQGNENQGNENQGNENQGNENQGDLTVGATCMSIYKEQVAAGASVEDAFNAIIEKLEFFGMVEKNPAWIQGFDTEITGYTDVYALMYGFGGFPFIMYSFETDDVETLKAMVDEHADLRWNICTMADEKFVEVIDGKVVLVMAPKSFEE